MPCYYSTPRRDMSPSDGCHSAPMYPENSDSECSPLAEARVCFQKPGSPTYDIETAFVRGTVYKELDKPFLGGGCRK